MIWDLQGTESQRNLVRQAIAACDFDFDKLAPSLAREGKTTVRVDWEDLSRYGQTAGATAARAHTGDAHPIERVIDGRKRVLGLFYLPPYTRVVLDLGLEAHPVLAQEVFLAEGAHAVDYHYMTQEHRRLFTNSVHTEQLPPGANTADGAAFHLDGHTCSWFDVNSYAWWVGEAFMEGFIEATSDVPVTINLAHPVGPEDRAVIRSFLGITDHTPEPEPAPESPPFFQGQSKSAVFHDSHKRIEPERWFASYEEAVANGLRPCKVCRPT